MKKTVLLFVSIIVMMLASCQKSEAQPSIDDLQPKVAKSQWITFTASCDVCAIEFEAPTPENPNKKETIYFGGWVSKSFENRTNLKSVKARVFTGVGNIRSQELTLKITESVFKNEVSQVKVVNSRTMPKDESIEIFLELNLNGPSK